jgi:hypothetical protein
MCDASGPLFVSDFTQLGYRVNLHHIEFTWMQDEIFP